MPLLLALVLVVPGVSRLAGLNGAYFRTALTLTNPTNSEMTVRVRFEETTETIVLPARVMRSYPDVLSDLFQVGSDRAGSIYVESDGVAPVVSARSYNDTAAGTFSEGIVAVPVGPTDGWLSALLHDESARLNVGATMPMQITIANRRIDMLAAGQLHRIDEALNAPPVFSARVVSPGVVYASRVDNSTGDASFLMPQRAYSEQLVAPAGAFNAGAGPAHSTLVITNPNDAAAEVQVEHYAGNTSRTGVATLTLAAHATERLDDFAAQRFGVQANVGYLRVLSDKPVVTWARAFESGRGYTAPVIGPEQLLTGASIIHGLAENTRFRTRVTFLNASDSGISVRVTVRNPAGVVPSASGVKNFGVNTRQLYAFDLFAAEMGLPNMGEYYLVIEPNIPGAAYVWATIVDRTSNDGSVERPVKSP